MAYLFCCPTAQELSALFPAIFPHSDKIPEMRPITGKPGGNEAFFLVTGSGPINAGISVGYALGETASTAEISAVICVGLAHSFNLEIAPLLSAWLVDKEIWPEYGLNDGIRVTARAFSTPLWKRNGQEDIYETIDLASLEEIGVSAKAPAREWPRCSALTLAGATASFSRRDALWNYWHVPLENMEGFAIGYAAMRYGVPCAEIRVVSAKAGPRSREEKDTEGALAKLGDVMRDLRLPH